MSGICNAHKEFVKGCRQCEAITKKIIYEGVPFLFIKNNGHAITVAIEEIPSGSYRIKLRENK